MNAQLDLAPKPRLGFLGAGWIGLARLRAFVERGAGEVVAVADACADACLAASDLVPSARVEHSLHDLLKHDLDGVVIATPNDQHAEQAIAVLENGLAVFCQKPLARTAAETDQVVAAARNCKRNLGVDFSYRHIQGVASLRRLVEDGTLGALYAIEATFHNAYGPGKEWFRDSHRSGGGCVIDLGVHLIDLVQWITGTSRARDVDARLHARGKPLRSGIGEAEDYAAVQWQTDGDACVRMTCSWQLHAGSGADIRLALFGTRGGAALRNVGGSFDEFVVERYEGAHTHPLSRSHKGWSGDGLLRWADAVAEGHGFDPACERLVDVAKVVDRIYAR